MSMPCRVCCGQKTVMLHVLPQHNMVIKEYEEELQTPTTSYETFPCPACAPQAPAEKVHVQEYEATVIVDYEAEHPSYIESVMRTMATGLGQKMLRDNQITLTKNPIEDLEYGRKQYKLVGKIGVISKQQVATMQERIEKHQTTLAREVMDEVVKQIENWGSHYGRMSLHKDEAYRFISGALSTVLKRREAKKAQP